jgi:hypothetical protein
VEVLCTVESIKVWKRLFASCRASGSYDVFSARPQGSNPTMKTEDLELRTEPLVDTSLRDVECRVLVSYWLCMSSWFLLFLTA